MPELLEPVAGVVRAADEVVEIGTIWTPVADDVAAGADIPAKVGDVPDVAGELEELSVTAPVAAPVALGDCAALLPVAAAQDKVV